MSAPFQTGRIAAFVRHLLPALLVAAPAVGAQAQTASTVPGEVLVQLRASSDLPALQTQHRLSLVARFGARPIFRFAVPAGTAVDHLLQALQTDPRVVVAEAHHKASAPEARKLTLWAVGTAGQYKAQWAPATLALAEAHMLATGAGVTVAVLDTGVDALHPALAGRLRGGRDFVDGDLDPSEGGVQGSGAHGHGTHVAGLVALAAPGATVMPLRVLDSRGEGSVWVLAEAMLHAVDPDGVPTTADGARIINLSLGTLQKTGILDTVKRLVECSDDDEDGDNGHDNALDDPGYQADRDRCNVLGHATVMAAAGNGGNTTEKHYPAAENAAGSLAVAASNSAGRIASFSNHGSWVDVAAPGEGLTSAVPGGGWGTWSGTSMATPLVSGVAALLVQRNPDWKPEDVTKRLRETATTLCGSPLKQVHAAAAVRGEVPAPLPCP